MDFEKLIHSAPNKEALIRIYPTYCSFNKAAADLLGLTKDSLINIYIDRQQKLSGRIRLYIGKEQSNAFHLIQRGSSFLIQSRPLVKRLAECLQGNGTYRICPEDNTIKEGNIYYNIFFKRYVNK